MNQRDVANRLRDRALSFHQILSEHKVYSSPLQEDDFLGLANDTIETTARSIYAEEGIPWQTLFSFPVSLLHDVKDFVYLQSWDTEEGIDVLLEELQKLFDRTSVGFEWNFDEQAQLLNFGRSGSKISCDCRSFEYLHYGYFKGGFSAAFDFIITIINACLREDGWYLYSTVGFFDQVAVFVLLPLGAILPISRLLITGDNLFLDERATWTWKGLPDDKKNVDIWDL